MVRLAATWASLCVLAHAAPLRVILDTDIGDDIDDAWALSALLQDPRVEAWLLSQILISAVSGHRPESGQV